MSPNLVKISSKCRHILDLSTEEKQKFLESFDIALSDCDGVVWLLPGPIPKSGDAINLLKNSGKQFKFISNNGMRTVQDYLDKIQKIGVKNIDKNDVIIPVKVIAKYVKKHYPQETCYCMGCDAFCQTLAEMGVKVENVTRPGLIKLEVFYKAVTAPKEAKLAVLDVNLYQTYADYTLAHQFLVKPDCQLFITASDTLAPFSEELTAVGPGLFVNAFVDISDKKPILFGKPSTLMADYMIEQYHINNRSRGLFIGDNLSVDIKFATCHGFQSLFVLSGANTKEDMLELAFEEQPDYYADSLGDFVEFFRDLEI